MFRWLEGEKGKSESPYPTGGQVSTSAAFERTNAVVVEASWKGGGGETKTGIGETAKAKEGLGCGDQLLEVHFAGDFRALPYPGVCARSKAPTRRLCKREGAGGNIHATAGLWRGGGSLWGKGVFGTGSRSDYDIGNCKTIGKTSIYDNVSQVEKAIRRRLNQIILRKKFIMASAKHGKKKRLKKRATNAGILEVASSGQNPQQ